MSHRVWWAAISERFRALGAAAYPGRPGVIQFTTATERGPDAFYLEVWPQGVLPRDGWAPDAQTRVEISEPALGRYLAGATHEANLFVLHGDQSLFSEVFGHLTKLGAPRSWLGVRAGATS